MDISFDLERNGSSLDTRSSKMLVNHQRVSLAPKHRNGPACSKILDGRCQNLTMSSHELPNSSFEVFEHPSKLLVMVQGSPSESDIHALETVNPSADILGDLDNQ